MYSIEYLLSNAQRNSHSARFFSQSSFFLFSPFFCIFNNVWIYFLFVFISYFRRSLWSKRCLFQVNLTDWVKRVYVSMACYVSVTQFEFGRFFLAKMIASSMPITYHCEYILNNCQPIKSKFYSSAPNTRKPNQLFCTHTHIHIDGDCFIMLFRKLEENEKRQ